MYISSIRASNPIRLLHASRKLSAEFQSVLWNPNGATSDVTSYEFSLYVPRRQSKEYSTNPRLLLRETRARFLLLIIYSRCSQIRTRRERSSSSSSTWFKNWPGKRKRNLSISYSRARYFRYQVEKCYLWLMGYGDHMVVQWPREGT